MDANFDNNDDCDDHENCDDKSNVDDDLTGGGKDGGGSKRNRISKLYNQQSKNILCKKSHVVKFLGSLEDACVCIKGSDYFM